MKGFENHCYNQGMFGCKSRKPGSSERVGKVDILKGHFISSNCWQPLENSSLEPAGLLTFLCTFASLFSFIINWLSCHTCTCIWLYHDHLKMIVYDLESTWLLALSTIKCPCSNSKSPGDTNKHLQSIVFWR